VAFPVHIRPMRDVGRTIEKRVSLLCVITLVPAFAEFLPFVGVEADMFLCIRSSHLTKTKFSESSPATSGTVSASSIFTLPTYTDPERNKIAEGAGTT
jgi:hypothetical protein